MMATLQRPKPCTLGDLIDDCPAALARLSVSGLQLDSRLVTSGDVFVATRGALVDGRDFIDQAIANGAVAVLAEVSAERNEHQSLHGDVAVLGIVNLGGKLSDIAGRFYQHPSRQFELLAVTGTNGKTSCSLLIMQMLNGLEKRCGVMGTLGVTSGATSNSESDALAATINTTPDAFTVQAHLAQWQADNFGYGVMEVSSHGLAQGRVAALQFELALFTNLSRDHMDYHGSMQAYGEAKRRLFQQPGLKFAVLNADDDFSNVLAKAIDRSVTITRYAMRSGSEHCDLWLEDIHYHGGGVSGKLCNREGHFTFESPLLGAFNLSNLLAVVASLLALGFNLAQLAAQVAQLTTVPGRMQALASAADIDVVIDYAHTPDALAQALAAARLHSHGKLWCVFGCGGDRDQGKRPLMAQIAQRDADYVVITSDNPRTENAVAIIDDMLVAIDSPRIVEADRAQAIAQAINQAASGDMVLIAGKGHETYQQVGREKLPFSDIKQARLALSQRIQTAGGPS